MEDNLSPSKDLNSIKLISIGVRYTNNDNDNINFQPVNISLPTGESNIQIKCPDGNPFKFVLRTENMTGTGSIRSSMNW